MGRGRSAWPRGGDDGRQDGGDERRRAAAIRRARGGVRASVNAFFVAGFVGSPGEEPGAQPASRTAVPHSEGEGWRCALSPANARKALKASTPGGHARRAPLDHRGTQGSGRDGAIAGRGLHGRADRRYQLVHIHLGKAIIVASVAPEVPSLAPDENVWIGFDQGGAAHLFDGKTGQALMAHPRGLGLLLAPYPSDARAYARATQDEKYSQGAFKQRSSP